VTTLPGAVEFETGRSWADTARLYLDITRPKVMALVLFTGLPALGLGQAWPTPERAAWVLLGTALAGGSCSALNAWWERDADARMARTRRRPLPAAMVLPRVVLGYGLALAVVSTAILAVVGGWLAAAVGLGTIVFYVGVYTMWLKPRTPQNIVIGGAAGATAPLIASAATTGSISVGALVLFGLIFLWTPPHFWAIALFRKAEYERAGFPMMPQVVGDQPTRWRSLAYALALIPLSLVPWWRGDLGLVYALAALGLGAWFSGWVVRSLIANDTDVDRGVFRASIVYLFLLFSTMLIDLIIPWGTT
jgi:protoheme IX farnesyltransferase